VVQKGGRKGGREGGREGGKAVPSIRDVKAGGSFHASDIFRHVETIEALPRNLLQVGREGGREEEREG